MKFLTKIATLLVLLLGLTHLVNGQQIPLYSQYFHNQFIYNPAWAGLYKYGSANLTYRSQWAGLKGAPRTMLFTMDFPFYEYRAGFGLNVHQDQLGAVTSTKGMLTYAYHIFGPYENSSKLSFGLSGGFVHTQIDFANRFILHPNDPNIINNTGKNNNFEFAFGINYLYKNTFQIGISAPQLINTGLKAQDDGESKIGLKNHFLINLRLITMTRDGMSRLEPTVMIRQTPNAPLQIDGGIRWTYADKFWGSAAYRQNFAITGAVGVILHRLRVGYSRDFAIGDFVGSIGATNEFMIGYKFKHIPTDPTEGRKGIGSSGLQRRKVYHPSRPGPLMKKYPRRTQTRKKAGKRTGKRPRARGKYRRF